MPSNFLGILSEVWDEITNLTTTISTNALLIFPIVFVFAGGIIGLTKKLLGLRRRR